MKTFIDIKVEDLIFDATGAKNFREVVDKLCDDGEFTSLVRIYTIYNKYYRKFDNENESLEAQELYDKCVKEADKFIKEYLIDILTKLFEDPF